MRVYNSDMIHTHSLQPPGSKATFSECESRNVFHHRLPRTSLSGRTYAYSSSSMPLAAAVILSDVSSEKSRSFYGYNYNCNFSTCQAYFRNFTITKFIPKPHGNIKECLRACLKKARAALYSTLFNDSTILMVFSLKCITAFTTAENTLVRIPPYTKLIGFIFLPNMTASTSTVVITYL